MLDSALLWKPPTATLTHRLRRLGEAARDTGTGAVVIAPGANLSYLVGYSQASHERLTALVVPAGGDPFVVVPALERPGWAGSPAETAGIDFRTWIDGEDPYQLIAGALPAGGTLAVDDALPVRHALPLAEAGDARLILAGPLIGRQRMIKDDHEIAALAAVGAANDRVHARIPALLRPGRTEAEVAADIAAALVEEGHAHAEFVIVGSGPNSASPHHDASDRVIAGGEAIVVDIGGPAPSGYQSDSTRTYCLGIPADPAFTEVHAVVQAAQEAGVCAARAGVSAASVDAAARTVIEQAGYGAFFITRTGHGIGLDVHEPPYIAAGNDELLQPGQVFSVEPGIYLPGRFGVRIEDIMAIGADGEPIRLNHSPRTWTIG